MLLIDFKIVVTDMLCPKSKLVVWELECSASLIGFEVWSSVD